MNSMVPWRNRGEYPVERLRRDFDTLFDRLWGSALAPFEAFEEEGGTPRFWNFDVQEGDKEIVVRAEMPGFDEKELDLQVADNVLTIKAEKEQKDDDQRRYSRFQRSFTLPSGANPDKIEANYRNGVLELHIPRPEESRPKRISLRRTVGEEAGQQSGKEVKK